MFLKHYVNLQKIGKLKKFPWVNFLFLSWDLQRIAHWTVSFLLHSQWEVHAGIEQKLWKLFQRIFIEMLTIYDFHSTPSANIHWNFNFFLQCMDSRMASVWCANHIPALNYTAQCASLDAATRADKCCSCRVFQPAFMKLTTTPVIRAMTFTKQVFQDIVLPINRLEEQINKESLGHLYFRRI